MKSKRKSSGASPLIESLAPHDDLLAIQDGRGVNRGNLQTTSWPGGWKSREERASMLKFLSHQKWHAAFCALVVSLCQNPCFAQSGAETPKQEASASDQQGSAAIVKELEAMKKRIEQLEAQLKKRNIAEERATVAAEVSAIPSDPPPAGPAAS